MNNDSEKQSLSGLVSNPNGNEEEEAHDAIFDRIMTIVGDSGPFQRRFNYIFNVGLVFTASMVYMNMVQALNVPDHWCYVPGREQTNLSIEEWKAITLPLEVDNQGQESFSKCHMYNITYSSTGNVNLETWNNSQYEIIKCNMGHEYDRQWYEETIVSQEHWVCDKDYLQNTIFSFNKIGEVIGTFILGQLGDLLGRQKIFYISLFTILIGRSCVVLTVPYYTLFSMSAVLDSLTATAIFQSPLIIAMETSRAEDRATIAMFQNLAWTGGICAMALIFWWVRHWRIFVIMTTAPLVFFLLFPKYMIESPRWLANQGRLKEAAKYLNRIAKINNAEKGRITESYLEGMLPTKKAEKLYGMASLFSSPRMALNTTLLVSCWSICAIGYFTLVLFIARMSGNPFLNFVGQCVVEAPAYVLGQYFGNKYGRRWTSVVSFILSSVLCVSAIFISRHTEWYVASAIVTILIKFATSIIFFVINLQSMETYPTCLRQTGISLGCISASGFTVLSPLIVYVGTKYDIRLPYMILGVLFLFGGVCALFLPETLHQKLPDSLEEAQSFGKDQTIWSLPKKPRKFHKREEKGRSNNTDELEQLNKQKCMVNIKSK